MIRCLKLKFRKAKLEEKHHRYVSYDDVVDNVKTNIDKMSAELSSCEKALEILTVGDEFSLAHKLI